MTDNNEQDEQRECRQQGGCCCCIGNNFSSSGYCGVLGFKSIINKNHGRSKFSER